jgi:hypothetical protein
MPIDYRKRSAVFRDVVGVEEAEGLLEWLQGKKSPTVDMSGCTHVHPANLQVLLAADTRVSALPTDASLADLLRTVLRTKDK